MDDKRGQVWWVVMDFGLRSNSRALFSWLDEHAAKECGEGVAVFWSTQPRPTLESQLRTLADDGTRLYLIGRNTKQGSIRGGFIAGGRKPPPWRGFYESQEDIVDVDDV